MRNTVPGKDSVLAAINAYIPHAHTYMALTDTHTEQTLFRAEGMIGQSFYSVVNHLLNLIAYTLVTETGTKKVNIEPGFQM